jgi:hypothetical protein
MPEPMDADKLASIVTAAIEQMEGGIERRLEDHVNKAIENHRRRMWVRETWCCKDMGAFAAKVWMMPNPPRRDETAFGSVNLELRGYNVNYCPFCGVKVS